MSKQKQSVTIIGIGNRFRGDDALGPEIAQRIKTENLPNVEVVEASGEGTTLIETMRDKDDVVIIDAVCSGATPGTVHRFEAHKQAIPSQFFNYSTHAFGVAEAIELARAMNQLPNHLLVYGIEGKNFEPGGKLSREVRNVTPKVVARVLCEIV
ncbi:hydrogenase maturation protease [candidate division KSB1 bacterium]|nr:hydrogenase maturation protease [candidate division KSB1 bacterium]NIR72784.1 hydrogenase maturation protease [candidate division KSB1 bacterium]NIS23740.1 hydrogenase maturation protease [candidate division KSB1 bacterium]NIT70661.1 hydrogenase maturation protease [candidate division KSB1 bacterium]NIU24388.1 hydrogenase maturation protease [candidate division KSB1 bacterium]